MTPWPTWALGVRVPNQDPEAIARGNAFAATANNPSALYYNPAGITQLSGHNFQAGALNYFGANSHFESSSGGSYNSEFKVLTIPQLYYTYSPKELPVSFGLGVYSPFGLAVEWPEDTGFRTQAIEGCVRYFTFNPIVAWKVCDELSVAIGPTINYSTINVRQGLLSPVPHSDRLSFEGDDTAFGFNAGLLFQPHPKWSFGLNYRSATTVDYSGHTEVSSPVVPSGRRDATARFEFPQIVSGGISFRPTPRWNIEADIDWTDWETLNTVVLSSSTIGPISFPLNWRVSWFYEIGVTHYFDNGYFVSCGYFFSSNSTREENFNPVVPDTDLHVGSIGGGYKGQHWRWALATQIITGPERSINKGAGNPANGTYQLTTPSLTFSVGYHF
jgi:long-chain fatty acid transport protein